MTKRVFRFLAVLVMTVTGVGSAFATAVYVGANGVTHGGAALSAATVLLFTLAAALLWSRWRRVALGLAISACVGGSAYVSSRLMRATTSTRVQVCVNGFCDGSGPWLARVPPEHEAARAGLYLSGLVGFMRGAEFDAFERLLDSEYARLDGVWAGLPNALLLRSTTRRVWYYRHLPTKEGTRPCVVFLHGFGGQLTPYLRAIVESELGRDFVVLAPVLDVEGVWWSESGVELVERLVRDHLPDQADPSQLFLIGLSNGGVGATRIATDPRTRRLFRGAVLISGIDIARASAVGTRFLVISGTDDPRFTPNGVTLCIRDLERAGADVTSQWYDADHFLMLTHAPQWTHDSYEWIVRSRED